MRGVLFVAFIAAGAAVYACDSFEESSPPVADAGAEEVNAPDAAPDVGADSVAPCEGEPDWAYPGGPVPTLATCNGAPNVDLLTSLEHCGRCNHSCGSGGSCSAGLCVPKQEDTILSVPMHVADGVLYYAHRAAFGADEVARLAPGGTPVVLGKFDPDAGSDQSVVSLTVAGDAVFARTKQSLRRTSRTIANASPPLIVKTLSAEQTAYVTAAPDGRLIVSASSQKRYDAVTPTGDITPFIDGIDYPLEAAFAGDRFVWMSEPFFYSAGGSSFLRIREGGTDRVLFESAAKMGGLVVYGEQAFVIRDSANGESILAIDLADGKKHSLFDGAIDNGDFQLTLAVDATHVYWVKSTSGGGVIGSEIWKRARCGGAAVRIASHAFILTPKVVGDRIYFGAQDGLWSLAK